jgi:hypothetical protein
VSKLNLLQAACAALALVGVPATVVLGADPASTTAANSKAVDRLNLDATAITGNRELPKVMSIVPWKAAEPPGGPDRPLGSLIDELLAPLDRDEFRREINYYRDLASPVASTSPVPVPGASPQ